MKCILPIFCYINRSQTGPSSEKQSTRNKNTEQNRDLSLPWVKNEILIIPTAREKGLANSCINLLFISRFLLIIHALGPNYACFHMSIKKSLGWKQKLPKDSWSVRNFCKELEVFHGNLVEDPSRKAPQKTKSELGSPRQLLFSPRAGSRILASSLCLFPHLLYYFLSPRMPTFFLRQHAQGHQSPDFKYCYDIAKLLKVLSSCFELPQGSICGASLDWRWVARVCGCGQGPSLYDSLASNSATSAGAHTLEGNRQWGRAVGEGIYLDGQKHVFIC